MPKAIVETPRRGAYLEQALAVARRVDAGEVVPAADYHLGFASAAQLFRELTPARLALLDALKGLGPVSIPALASHLGRDDGGVQTDTARLLELDLVEKNADGQVWVPWEEIQIRVAVGGAQAA
jgi:predicted transcriptional regulator